MMKHWLYRASVPLHELHDTEMIKYFCADVEIDKPLERKIKSLKH